MYEKLIEQLRAAHGGPDDIKMCQNAADALENQQREIEALKQIIEKQSGLTQKLADMALELDQIKAERAAAVKDIPHKCVTCGLFEGGACPILAYKDYPNDCDHWKWRGPQKEE